MRILFINDYHLPQMYRGTEINTHALCATLQEAGHETAVLAALTPHGLVGFWGRARLKLDRRRAWVLDRVMGYPTFRAWSARRVLTAVVEHWRPEVLVCQASDRELAHAALQTGRPTFLYLHFHPNWEKLPESGHAKYITNSLFCQNMIREAYAVDSTVIRPIVIEKDYKTKVTGQEVTFIGLSLDKGADLVLEIAKRLPDIRFRIFANHLRLGDEEKALLQRAKAMPNVRISPPQRSGKRIYRNTRVLLAPSRWLETWGRVVTEAHVNDIPALASNRGGLPEAVGPGGLCLPLDAPIGEWASALRRMMEDNDAYAQYQRGIREHKASKELSPAGITADFLKTIGA